MAQAAFKQVLSNHKKIYAYTSLRNTGKNGLKGAISYCFLLTSRFIHTVPTATFISPSDTSLRSLRTASSILSPIEQIGKLMINV